MSRASSQACNNKMLGADCDRFRSNHFCLMYTPKSARLLLSSAGEVAESGAPQAPLLFKCALCESWFSAISFYTSGLEAELLRGDNLLLYILPRARLPWHASSPRHFKPAPTPPPTPNPPGVASFPVDDCLETRAKAVAPGLARRGGSWQNGHLGKAIPFLYF